MKKIKKTFLTLVLTLALLLSGTATFFATNHKSTNAFADDFDTIYYFSDSDPILDSASLFNLFGSQNIIYDIHYYISAEEIYSLIGNGYFDEITDSIVILEIKAEKLDHPVQTSYLCASLKGNGNVVVFVSPYSQSEYEYDEFFFDIDIFYECKEDRLLNFVKYAINDMASNICNTSLGSLSKTCIFIDRRFFNIEPILGRSIQDLCEASPYLRILFKELGEALVDYDRTDIHTFAEYASYFNSENILLLVHNDANEYVNILTGTLYQLDHLSDFENTFSTNNIEYAERMFAMGIWALEQQFYDFIFALQNSLELLSNDLPVYVLEEDEFVQQEGTLEVMLGTGDSDEEYVDDAEMLLALLAEYFN